MKLASAAAWAWAVAATSDTGGGMVWRAGRRPAWPWAMDGTWAWTPVGGAPSGRWLSRYLRAHLGFDLDSPSTGLEDRPAARQIAMYRVMFLTQGPQKITFKQGAAEPVKQLGIGVERDWGAHGVLIGQAGSALWGKAGGLFYGLFGLGLRWPVSPSWRVGVQSLGAGGGGGVKVAGGAITQNEVYAMWQGQRWLVRVASASGATCAARSSPTHVARGSGYAFGAAGH